MTDFSTKYGGLHSKPGGLHTRQSSLLSIPARARTTARLGSLNRSYTCASVPGDHLDQRSETVADSRRRARIELLLWVCS